MVRMTVKEEEKKKPIGIINKEVDSIGHRSILTDELVLLLNQRKKILDMISFFSFSYRIDEYMLIFAIDLYLYIPNDESI